MDTEIRLVPLFQSTIQTMSRSVLFKHADASRYISIISCFDYKCKETLWEFCRNVHVAVSIAIVLSTGISTLLSIQDSFESAVFYQHHSSFSNISYLNAF